MSLAAELARGVAALGLAIAPGVRAQLLAYLELLHKWNAAYNLTAVRGRPRLRFYLGVLLALGFMASMVLLRQL